jgi:hypothetical protein
LIFHIFYQSVWLHFTRRTQNNSFLFSLFFFLLLDQKTLYLDIVIPKIDDWTDALLRVSDGTNLSSIVPYVQPKGTSLGANFAISSSTNVPRSFVIFLSDSQFTIRLSKAEPPDNAPLFSVDGLKFTFSIVKDCPIGYARASVNATCTACPPGTFKNSASDSVSCTPCPPQTNSTEFASTSCFDLPPPIEPFNVIPVAAGT